MTDNPTPETTESIYRAANEVAAMTIINFFGALKENILDSPESMPDIAFDIAATIALKNFVYSVIDTFQTNGRKHTAAGMYACVLEVLCEFDSQISQKIRDEALESGADIPHIVTVSSASVN